MTNRQQQFLKNFFRGVYLEGQRIDEIVITANPDSEGIGVVLISSRPYKYHMCLHFPETWEVPTLITKEEWQEYLETSREADGE